MPACYFMPKKDSATICSNCGLEKYLHTRGQGIEPAMQEQEDSIRDGNKLIAGFMGLHFSKHQMWCEMSDLSIVGGIEYASIWRQHLFYHSSFDWLIPVVQKINDLSEDYPMATYSVLRLNIAAPITEVWQAVIDFIKRYNQNK